MLKALLISLPLSVFSVLVLAPSSMAQLTAAQRQIVDAASEIVITRINQSSCQDFANSLAAAQTKKATGDSAARDRVLAAAQNNPQIRAEFVARVAGPLANKLFDCGLIP